MLKLRTFWHTSKFYFEKKNYVRSLQNIHLFTHSVIRSFIRCMDVVWTIVTLYCAKFGFFSFLQNGVSVPLGQVFFSRPFLFFPFTVQWFSCYSTSHVISDGLNYFDLSCSICENCFFRFFWPFVGAWTKENTSLLPWSFLLRLFVYC